MKKEQQYPEFADKIRACFEHEDNYRHMDADVSFCQDASGYEVTISQEYNYLEINFAILFKLAEVFGTQDFDIDKTSRSGCETCDFGSRYSHEFYVKGGKLPEPSVEN